MQRFCLLKPAITLKIEFPARSAVPSSACFYNNAVLSLSLIGYKGVSF